MYDHIVHHVPRAGHDFYNFGKGFHRHQNNAFIFSHKHVGGSRTEDFSKLPICICGAPRSHCIINYLFIIDMLHTINGNNFEEVKNLKVSTYDGRENQFHDLGDLKRK